MPELPEVETVRSVLEPQLAGHRIQNITIGSTDVIAYPTPQVFTRRIIGRTVRGMDRRGKFLILYLDNGARMMIHLRMTGQLLVAPPAFPTETHTHILFRLDSGNELRFIDMRRFGRLWLIGAEEEDLYSGISRLGPEPFDEAFDAAYMEQVCGNKRTTIKQCLLDQRIVAGIGNIYADEILFDSGIYPACPAYALSREQWQRLAEVIPSVLGLAIKRNSMTEEEYLAGKGKEYRSDAALKAYGHEGAPCPVCGTSFVRMVIAGRSSYYCTNCQKQ